MVAAAFPLEVVAALGLDGPDGEPVLGGRVSQVWRGLRSGRTVAVRRSPWFRRLDEVAYECDVLRALAATPAPVAEVVAGPVEFDDAVWVAFTWVDGRHPPVPVPDPMRYGRLLARLHGWSASLAARLGQRPSWGRLDEFLTRPRRGGPTLQETLPDFERALGGAGTRFRQEAELVHERLLEAGVADLPLVVAHGDFGPHQVLERDGSVAAVVDWDFTHLDTALADLAIGTSLARPTMERAAALLRGYLDVALEGPGDLSLLGDLRRAFHLDNLGNQVCVRWAHGVDVTQQLATIRERLDREQWWGPTLAVGARAASRSEAPRARLDPLPDGASDLDVARHLADRAAVVAMHHFEAGVTAEAKPDDTPVTVADRAVELLVREALRQLRPDDAVLGEELGATTRRRRTWIVDPIDGTAAFAAGDPNWRIQLALREDEEITVAVVDSPALGSRWWAEAGAGAFEAAAAASGVPRRLQVSAAATVEGSLVGVHPRSAAARVPPEVRPAPWTPLPLIELVRGDIDAFYVDCCHVWDHAPWILLVREAGGAFTDHAGTGEGESRGGLYSNGHLHQELCRRLRPPITPLRPLSDGSPGSVAAAVVAVLPDLAGRTLALRPHGGGDAAAWRRGTATVGDGHVVKFAWSQSAARKLWHEATVLTTLARIAPQLPLPTVEAASRAPSLFVTKRLRGAPVWGDGLSAMAVGRRRSLATQLGSFLARLQQPEVLVAVEAATGPLPGPVPQADTAALRTRLPPFIGPERAATVSRWCDWVDAVLAVPAPRVLLHGDFAGHNVLWDDDQDRLVGVVDLEEAAAGDPNYDFRYLPAQAESLDFLHDVAAAHAAAGGTGYDLRRVMAWSVRTVLGDALWRSEAGVPLPFDGDPRRWVDELAARLDVLREGL